MSNRLSAKIKQVRKERKKLLCVYITLGFPNVRTTEKLLVGLDRADVDILELGFPFSDPLADGPTIQAASERALRNPITIDLARKVVLRSRGRGVTMPIIFFSYANPILQYGVKRFAKGIYRDGFDGVIIPDLPLDEDRKLVREIRRAGLSFINLVAPTSSNKRMEFLAKHSEQFIYYVSRCGVTGERDKFEGGLAENVCRLRRFSRYPILVGFGISSPQQAKIASRISDGVVVGSAIINAIRRANGRIGPAVKVAEKFARVLHNYGFRNSLPPPVRARRAGAKVWQAGRK